MILKKKIALVSLILSIVSILIYTKYYYGQINARSLMTQYIIIINILGNLLFRFIELFIDKEIFKYILVGILIIYVINKLNIEEIIKNFNSIEFKEFRIKLKSNENSNGESSTNTQISKAISSKDIDKPMENNSTPEIITNNINDSISDIKHIDHTTRSKIERLFIDSPFIVSIIDAFLSNKKNIIINLSLIPYKITLEQISQIFEYTIRSNSVVIKSIKPELESLVVDVFRTLQDDGVITLK